MIYAFKCLDCGEEQEIECLLADKDKQACLFCHAPPEKMKPLINLNTKTYGSHVSWSTWKVDVGT